MVVIGAGNPKNDSVKQKVLSFQQDGQTRKMVPKIGLTPLFDRNISPFLRVLNDSFFKGF